MKFKDFITQFEDGSYDDFDITLSISEKYTVTNCNTWVSIAKYDIEVVDIGYSEKVIILGIIKGSN